MATSYEAQSSAAGEGDVGGATALIDRWIYVLMAIYLIVIVLVGFVPDSIQKIAAVEAGLRPPFPIVLHIHAVLMGAWMLLLLVQTTLMATGRKSMHMQLGIMGAILAPALAVAGAALVPILVQTYIDFSQGASLEAQAAATRFLEARPNMALVQLRIGICFLLLVGIALAVRKSNSGMHKRLIILATTVPLPAAFDRMPFLYHTLPDSPLTVILWPLLSMAWSTDGWANFIGPVLGLPN
jgi:hypothetical protein